MRQDRSRGRSATVTCTDFTQGPSRDRVVRASVDKETHLALPFACQVTMQDLQQDRV